MREPSFEILEDCNEYLLIRDVGPHDEHPTVTNAAERVVEMLGLMLRPGQRLEYVDSGGELAQILVRDGKFAGFAVSEMV